MAINAVLVGQGNTAAASATTAAGTTAASGSTFVIGVVYDAGATGTTPTDSKGNVYTKIGTTQTTANGEKVELWAKQNGTGGASHTATFTTVNNNFCCLFLIEITGALAASFDVTAQGNDAASPFTITTPTLGQANEVVITLCAANSGVTSTNTYSSSNTTILAQESAGASFYTGAISKLVVASTSAVTPSFTCTTGTAAGLITATFKDVTAGGGGGGQIPGGFLQNPAAYAREAVYPRLPTRALVPFPAVPLVNFVPQPLTLPRIPELPKLPQLGPKIPTQLLHNPSVAAPFVPAPRALPRLPDPVVQPQQPKYLAAVIDAGPPQYIVIEVVMPDASDFPPSPIQQPRQFIAPFPQAAPAAGTPSIGAWIQPAAAYVREPSRAQVFQYFATLAPVLAPPDSPSIGAWLQPWQAYARETPQPQTFRYVAHLGQGNPPPLQGWIQPIRAYVRDPSPAQTFSYIAQLPPPAAAPDAPFTGAWIQPWLSYQREANRPQVITGVAHQNGVLSAPFNFTGPWLQNWISYDRAPNPTYVLPVNVAFLPPQGAITQPPAQGDYLIRARRRGRR